MNSATYEYGYVTGQKNDQQATTFSQFEQLNTVVKSQYQWSYDLPYGYHPREFFDVCYAQTPPKAVVIYLHAGYWQSRDKSQFHFIAQDLASSGYDTVFVNYPLCPEVNLQEIISSLRYALCCVVQHIQNRHQKQLPMLLSGHSAGAHLISLLTLQMPVHMREHFNLKGILPISGIYELNPLIHTTLNQKLALSQQDAQHCSPVWLVENTQIPAAFFVGANETLDFIDQSSQMQRAWKNHHRVAELHIINQRDHFNILFEFQKNGVIFNVIETWMSEA